MATIVKMPQLGESVVEGTVARWLKAPGDPVDKLEPLLEISTDKIDTEVPAPASGTLLEIVVPEGATVRAGSVLAYIGAPGETLPSAPAGSDASPKKVDTTVVTATPAPASDEKPSGRAFISPVVGRIAAEHQVDLAEVQGSGLGGRITKKDILAHLARKAAPVTKPAAASVPAEPAIQESWSAPSSDEFLEPLTAMRRAIAHHMVQSVQTSPHVTTIFEADLTAVVQHREAHKAEFAAKGVQLTYTPYFVAAAVAGLKAVPQVNSRFSEQGLIYRRRIHIGIAVALTNGLVVPVIQDADEKNLQGLARAVNELSGRARNGSLGPDAVQGGTFTITNHGVSGSLAGTPIINQPQTGILGIGAISKRPVVRSSSNSLLPSADDAIVIRPMCYLSFSFDHRVLDGAQADAFLTVVKETLENWEA
jgi:2-oxoisovalerate dehydrogenase E2 component (dihydrolipoyl transacylase)